MMAYSGVTSGHGVGGYDGGCSGIGQRTIGGPNGTLSGVDPLVKQLSEEASARTAADPRVRRVTEQWSRCMRDNGYKYSAPFEPTQDGRYDGTEAASPVELQQARTDIACLVRSRFYPTQHAVESELEAAIEANADALRSIKNTLDAEVQRAKKVLSGK